MQKQLEQKQLKNSWLLPPIPGERCSTEACADGNVPISVGEYMGGSFRVSAYASATGRDVFAAECAILQAANDVACRGGIPRSVALQVVFPVEAEEADVQELVEGIKSSCGRLGLELTSFQAQVNPAVARTMISVTVLGLAERLKRMQEAGAGQDIVMCGFAGLEGSLRIARERRKELEKRFVPVFLRQMEGLRGHLDQTGVLRMLHVSDEVRVGDEKLGNGHILYEVSAMQQAASGGIFAALWELCEAAGIGLELDLKKIQICQETIEICEYYQLNPYQMTSAGCVLLLTNQAEALLHRLEQEGVRAAWLGKTTADKARILVNGAERRYLERPAPDELMRFLKLELGV